MRDRSATLLQIPDCGDESIDILTRIVERQGGTYGAFQTEAPQDRLSTMVTGSHCYTLLVQSTAYLFGSKTVFVICFTGGFYSN